MTLAHLVRMSAVVLVLAALAGCGSAPIHNVNNHSLSPTTDRLSQQEIDAIVVREASERGWKIEPISPGHMKGILEVRAHRATVDIRVDKKNLNIKYLESSNLNERNGVTIDRSYNRWIGNLESDISTAIAAAGAAQAITR